MLFTVAWNCTYFYISYIIASLPYWRVPIFWRLCNMFSICYKPQQSWPACRDRDTESLEAKEKLYSQSKCRQNKLYLWKWLPLLSALWAGLSDKHQWSAPTWPRSCPTKSQSVGFLHPGITRRMRSLRCHTQTLSNTTINPTMIKVGAGQTLRKYAFDRMQITTLDGGLTEQENTSEPFTLKQQQVSRRWQPITFKNSTAVHQTQTEARTTPEIWRSLTHICVN